MVNFIYIVQEAEQVRNGSDIYKLGMTNRDVLVRLRGYRRGTRFCFAMDLGNRA